MSPSGAGEAALASLRVVSPDSKVLGRRRIVGWLGVRNGIRGSEPLPHVLGREILEKAPAHGRNGAGLGGRQRHLRPASLLPRHLPDRCPAPGAVIPAPQLGRLSAMWSRRLCCDVFCQTGSFVPPPHPVRRNERGGQKTEERPGGERGS